MHDNSKIAVENAIELAVRFHRGQCDKAGKPYILHPLTLMLKTADPIEQQAAVLHDLLEDTDATIEDLMESQIHPEAIKAIELLTHREVSYAVYIIDLKRNPVARAVKLLDLHDNYRLDRVAYREAYASQDAKRLQKYILTKQYLCDEISEEVYRRQMELIGEA
jgi:guanosine-3',5'-bis(diphosphate) 3'-pyrophosphohydrolase